MCLPSPALAPTQQYFFLAHSSTLTPNPFFTPTPSQGRARALVLVTSALKLLSALRYAGGTSRDVTPRLNVLVLEVCGGDDIFLCVCLLCECVRMQMLLCVMCTYLSALGAVQWLFPLFFDINDFSATRSCLYTLWERRRTPNYTLRPVLDRCSMCMGEHESAHGYLDCYG